uniref:Uncharacterized protein n=1 Tax=viral metagenome TaxID=1070528 RepID=A0A6C0FAD4_9ZZZZ
MSDSKHKSEECMTDDRFQHPWSKLDKGSKLNRLSMFTKMEKLTHDLSDTQEEALKIQLTQLFSCGHLNRIVDVEYDSETMKITNIPNLSFDTETCVYTFAKPVVKKSKSKSNSSKSRIERHFSRSLK